MATRPTLAEFLSAPIEEVRKVAPATVVLTNGGTRRRAVLEGISPSEDEYACWSRRQMIRCLDLIFRHGVQHIFTTILAESNYNEETKSYRNRLVKWTDRGLAGPEAMSDYLRLGWQARLVGAESWPELAPAAERLRELPCRAKGPSVWFTVASHPETRWESIFHAVSGRNIRSRTEAIRTIYGQDIPLATMFIGSGKPQVYASIVPPLLVGHMQCYWRQHLGYDLGEHTLRAIFHDYAFGRNTWRRDKTGRAEEISAYQCAWENPPVVGLGTRLGPFWYPAPISDPFGSEGAADIDGHQV